ncbi:NAD(P)H-binding protein [Micromonospora sp. NPDC050276]|uniref:NAD(P)H-binding protein n=1 Tax=Micromonospora sp. NPDC050276 TaxID=3364278 RepID=UPI0037ABE87C
MRVTVFGATGGTGQHLMRQALAVGHHVTAVVRDPARLHHADHPRLEPDPTTVGHTISLGY